MNKIEKLLKELCPKGVEFRELGELVEINTGKLNANAQDENGLYPFFTCDSKPYKINTWAFDMEAILISGNGSKVGHINYYNGKFNAYQRTYILSNCNKTISIFFLYFYLKTYFRKYLYLNIKKASIPYITLPVLAQFKIPIPPLEIQKEIVKILDTFTELEAELEARRAQYEYYRNKLLSFEYLNSNGGGYELKTLGEILDYTQPTKYIVKNTDYSNDFEIPVLTAGASFILGYTNEREGAYNADSNPCIIFDDFTTSFHWVDFDFKIKSSAMKILTPKDKIESKILFRFVFYAMKCINYQPIEHARQWLQVYSQFQIPIPSLETQEKIVSILDKFHTLTTDLQSGIPAEIEARKKQYAYYRNKLLTFKKLEI